MGPKRITIPASVLCHLHASHFLVDKGPVTDMCTKAGQSSKCGWSEEVAHDF